MKSLNTVLLFLSLIFLSSCSKDSNLIVSSSGSGYGKAFYIDPLNGNDANNGREISSPVKTFYKAGAFCSNGDTVYVKGGVYTAFRDVIAKTQTDLGYIYFRPYQGQTVTLDGIGGIFDESEAILTIKNSTYIDISGFEIRNNATGRGINILSETKYCNLINITNCSIHDVGSGAISLGASNVLIQNCEIYNSCLNNKNRALGDNGHWSAAIQTYFKYNPAPYVNGEFIWTGINITNNKIYNNWGEGLKISRAGEYIITYNKIYNCYNASMIFDNSRNGTVFNNIIYTTGDDYNRINPSGYNRPMQGVLLSNEKNSFFANPMTENITVYNNLLIRTSAPFAWFYDVNNPIPSNTYFNIKIIYNTSYNTIGNETFALDVNFTPTRYTTNQNEFKNNIIYKPVYNSVNQNYFTASNDYQQYWSITNNCFVSGDIPSFISGVNITGNPSFVNPSALTADGFKIANNSICSGAGVSVTSVALDYFLNLRNPSPSIGFYELTR